MRLTSFRAAVAIALTVTGVIAAGPTLAAAGGMPAGGRGGPSPAPGGFGMPGNRGGFSFNPSASFSFNPNAPFSFNPPPRVAPHRHFRRQQGFFAYGGGAYAVPYVSEPAYYDPPAPVVVEPSPSYTQVVVYTQPAAYPPAVSSAAPAAPARPSVVEFQDGRYELRGDGVNTPYSWVWIPNPPAAPPAAATTAPTAAAPAARDVSSARRSQLYRWVDDQDVVHLTDRIESVPEEYREQVKRIGPS